MESVTSWQELWIIRMVGSVTLPKLQGILNRGDPKSKNTVGSFYDLVQLFRDAHYRV